MARFGGHRYYVVEIKCFLIYNVTEVTTCSKACVT